MSVKDERIARRLIETAGETFAEQAGIALTDKPAPLYRLLVLSVLVSAPIQADIAVAACRELVKAGFGTPRRMAAASWQERVDALGRGHYVRYDESTATALGEGAEHLLAEYHGDLRELRRAASGDVSDLRRRLQAFKRLGPTGSDVFCREAQALWPELRPYLDRKALHGAARIGLPEDPGALADLVDDADLARFAAALVRAGIDRQLAESLS